MSASASGPLLSSLLFKLKNAPGDADGFLLGEVHKHKVENITDSQSSGTREEKRLCIQSYVYFRRKYRFYDCFGRPDTAKIEKELGTRYENVIGWFSYRRNSSHRMSMRERVLHKQLMNMFSNVSKQDFLFALVTDQLVTNSTIHSTEYSFHHWIGNSPQVMSMEIVNLRASASVPYQTMPVSQLPPTLIHYTSVLQEQRSHFMDSNDHMIHAQSIDNLYDAVIKRLKPLTEELTKSSQEVAKLGKEVTTLQKEVDNLRATQTKTKEEENQEPSPSSSKPAEVPMLISLDSPTDELPVSDSALKKNLETSNQSYDLLSDALVLSNPLLKEPEHGNILQPEIIPSLPMSDSEPKNMDCNTTVIQQSQELF